MRRWQVRELLKWTTKAATFGQLRQQYLTDAERNDCAALVAQGLLKDVVGTTFMLTDAGRRH